MGVSLSRQSGDPHPACREISEGRRWFLSCIRTLPRSPRFRLRLIIGTDVVKFVDNLLPFGQGMVSDSLVLRELLPFIRNEKPRPFPPTIPPQRGRGVVHDRVCRRTTTPA